MPVPEQFETQCKNELNAQYPHFCGIVKLCRHQFIVLGKQLAQNHLTGHIRVQQLVDPSVQIQQQEQKLQHEGSSNEKLLFCFFFHSSSTQQIFSSIIMPYRISFVKTKRPPPFGDDLLIFTAATRQDGRKFLQRMSWGGVGTLPPQAVGRDWSPWLFAEKAP